MSTNDKQVRDEFLEAAAAEAVSANTPEESRAYAQQLAAASPEEQRQARLLQETAARLAAASPYMNPPEDLRGKVLAATAPATFKMEDYRRATHDNGRFWRFGLIAATLFLVAAAYWNVNLQSTVKAQTAQIGKMDQALKDQNKALQMLVDPRTERADLKIKGEVFGTAFVDQLSKTVVVGVPRELLASGKVPVLTLTQADGQKVSFRTFPVAFDPTNKTGAMADVSNGFEMQPLKTNIAGAPRNAGFGLP